MDMKKEREAFSEWHESAYGEYVTWGNDYPVSHIHNDRWEAWQAAKASAVPQWISVDDQMPEEGEEVFVHHYGHVVQATRDKQYSGGFKQRNCYGWEDVSSYISHWMPKSIELPEKYHFYYENDAKQKP